MSSATDELRRLLDERGVKWRAWDGVHPITVWHDEQCVYEYMERTLLDGVKPHTGEVVDGTGRLEAVIHVCSPEQAVEATLGSCNCSNNCTNSERTGTCRITDNGPWGYPYVCSACGASFDADVNNGEFNFCPNCGRRVEQ